MRSGRRRCGGSLMAAALRQLLSESSKGMEGMDPSAAAGMGEDVMKKLMEDMEGMSQREDFGEVMDNLMHQLVGKDIMQEPVKKICEKVPSAPTPCAGGSCVGVDSTAAALARCPPCSFARPVSRVVGGEQERALRGRLRAVRALRLGRGRQAGSARPAHRPATDRDSYGKQYGYFQRLAAVYETEPENHARVMELLQEVRADLQPVAARAGRGAASRGSEPTPFPQMQETGAPPESIIKELAPGLEFGPDGMPVLPNMVRAAPVPHDVPREHCANGRWGSGHRRVAACARGGDGRVPADSRAARSVEGPASPPTSAATRRLRRAKRDPRRGEGEGAPV